MKELTVLLFLVLGGVVFVNGWTDAPNTILSVTASKTLSDRRAALLSAVCHGAGLLFFWRVHPQVAGVIGSLVNSSGAGREERAVLLCGMIAVILYAVAAWWKGVPTSESHGLAAGVTGAAAAFYGWDNISPQGWAAVAAGFFCAFLWGIAAGGLSALFLGKRLEKKSPVFLKCWVVFVCIFLSFFHAAQDGLKFMGLLILLSDVSRDKDVLSWAAVGVAALMSLGTLLGGGRILRRMESAAELSRLPLSLAADAAALLGIAAASFSGLPVSTTQIRMMSAAGASLGAGERIDFRSLRGMAAWWAAAFPLCGGLGYLLGKFILCCPIG